MDSGMPDTPNVKTFLPLIVVLLVLGWGGLFVLVNLTTPTLWPRWLFFFMVVIGFTGLAMPAVVFLYNRFPPALPPEDKVIVRQSLWAGVYVALILWMSLGQVVNFGLALLCLVGISLFEIFLRVRENSLWRRP